MLQRTAIVVGAGIAGLAAARTLAVRGCKVTVLEKTQRATGASIRNFGMILPVGQADGKYYERAMLSRQIWKQVCKPKQVHYNSPMQRMNGRYCRK
jgi:glycine/D-amino acid oxidase-like deaminating enzyme